MELVSLGGAPTRFVDLVLPGATIVKVLQWGA